MYVASQVDQIKTINAASASQEIILAFGVFLC
jgi:hypothetical protein